MSQQNCARKAPEPLTEISPPNRIWQAVESELKSNLFIIMTVGRILYLACCSGVSLVLEMQTPHLQ